MNEPSLLDHPRLDEIMDAIDEGQSQKEIGIRFGVNRLNVATLMKHLKLRNAPDTEKALEALRDMDMRPEEISDNLPSTRVYGGVDVLEEMLSMKKTAERIRQKAETAEKLPQAIGALREQMRIIEVMMKMADRMRQRQEFNPWNHPDVISYQEGLLAILRKHPKAMEDVIEYVNRYGGGAEGLDQEGEGQ